MCVLALARFRRSPLPRWTSGAALALVLVSVGTGLTLLMTSACLNGLVMVVYSALLIQLNRRGLPAPLLIALSGFWRML